MPSFTIHLLIPLLFLLALRFDARKVFILLPLSIVPDLDYFFGFHRATLGNLLVPAIPLAIYIAAHQRPDWKLFDRWPAIGRGREWAFVAFFYVGSHLLLDTFQGGIVPFYPLSSWTLCLYAYVQVETATNTPHLEYGDCSHPGIPDVAEVYTFLDLDETAMLAFSLVVSLTLIAQRFMKRRAARETPP